VAAGPANRPLAWLRRLLAPLLERLVELEMVDRAVALGSQAFVALIPLLVVWAALVPGGDRNGVADSLVDRFDLTGGSADAVRRVFAQPAEVRDSVSILGAVLLVFSALSFCRALQRLYERAWRLPPLGFRGTPTQLAWLAFVVVYLSLVSGLNTAAVDWLGSGGRLAVALGTSFVLWLWTPYLLLGRRVARRSLYVTGAITAVCMTALSVASVIYMPQSITTSAERFGPIGIAVSLVSWLIGAGFVVVIAVALGAVLTERSPRLRAGAAG
jgi:membrane protein